MAHRSALRTVRSALVVLIAGSALALAGSTAAGASIRLPGHLTTRSLVPATTTITELGGATKVETANKVSWDLIVSWNNIDGSAPTLGLGLVRSVTSPSAGDELHEWNFNVTSSTFKFNDKTGTLDSGTQANPVGSVDLTFTTTSSKAATCTSGKETDYSGTLSGKASLVTGLKGGGTVSGTYTFNVETPYVDVDNGCVPPATNDCTAELIAGSGNTTGAQVVAGTLTLGGTTDQVVAIEEQATLSAPSGATRTDELAMENESGKVYATYTGSEVKMASTGLVNGSGTVSKGKPMKEGPETCKFGGKTYTDTTVFDSPAAYAGTFSATPSIGTTMTVPASTKTGLYLVTKAKVS